MVGGAVGAVVDRGRAARQRGVVGTRVGGCHQVVAARVPLGRRLHPGRVGVAGQPAGSVEAGPAGEPAGRRQAGHVDLGFAGRHVPVAVGGAAPGRRRRQRDRRRPPGAVVGDHGAAGVVVGGEARGDGVVAQRVAHRRQPARGVVGELGERAPWVGHRGQQGALAVDAARHLQVVQLGGGAVPIRHPAQQPRRRVVIALGHRAPVGAVGLAVQEGDRLARHRIGQLLHPPEIGRVGVDGRRRVAVINRRHHPQQLAGVVERVQPAVGGVHHVGGRPRLDRRGQHVVVARRRRPVRPVGLGGVPARRASAVLMGGTVGLHQHHTVAGHPRLAVGQPAGVAHARLPALGHRLGLGRQPIGRHRIPAGERRVVDVELDGRASLVLVVVDGDRV